MLKNSDAVQGGFVAIVGSIYERGVEEAVPWLIAMVCVVVVDLFAGVRCAWPVSYTHLTLPTIYSV